MALVAMSSKEITRICGDFSARWSVCWATTYTFEPSFFETVIARRMGEPPRNIVVLADGPHLADLWARIGPAERWSIRGANRLERLVPRSDTRRSPHRDG